MNGNPLIYTDPTGECPWRLPVLSGAASGAGLDLLLQLLQNGGDLNCIDWESLGLSAALGAGGGGLSAKLLKLLSAKSATQIVVRTTRSGEKAVRITRADGSVVDISPQRVKEYIPNIHPNAPPGTLQRVRFSNAQPGSKGLKRDPTPAELETLRNLP